MPQDQFGIPPQLSKFQNEEMDKKFQQSNLSDFAKQAMKTAAEPKTCPHDITSFRLQIDAAINSFPFMHSSRETALAHTNLQRAFMWLGESLKASGSQSPYVNSSNPANSTIEPQADHTENTLVPRWQTIDQTQTARVKDFRYYLEQLIQNFRQWKEQSESAGKHYDACIQSSFMALIEAKCWLGWELNRIKKFKETPFTEQGPTTPLAL